MSQKQISFCFDDGEDEVLPVKRGPKDHGRKFRDRVRFHNQTGMFQQKVKCESCDNSATFDRPGEVGWLRYVITGSMRRKVGVVCSADCFLAAISMKPDKKESKARTRVLSEPVARVKDELDEMF